MTVSGFLLTVKEQHTVPQKSAGVNGWLLSAALIYWFLSSVLHLEVSFLIVEPMGTPWGDIVLRDYTWHLAGVFSVVVTAWIVLHVFRSARPVWLAGAWLFLAALILIINFYLMASPVENIHFPQYALLAWLLGKSLDRRRVRFIVFEILFAVLALGIVDELIQYFYLTPDYVKYMDFNDFLLNLTGGMAGVLLYYGGQRGTAAKNKPVRRSPAFALMVVLITFTAMLLISGRLQQSPPAEAGELPPGSVWEERGMTNVFMERSPDYFGTFQPAFHKDDYYVLSPVVGTVILALLLAGAVLLHPWRAEKE